MDPRFNMPRTTFKRCRLVVATVLLAVGCLVSSVQPLRAQADGDGTSDTAIEQAPEGSFGTDDRLDDNTADRAWTTGDYVGFGLSRLAAGLLVGFAVGMTGVGGGVLLMPTLTGLFGMPTSLAVPTANFYSVMQRTHAVYEHKKLRNIRRRATIWFLVGGVPAALLVKVLLVVGVHRGWFAKEQVDRSLQGLVIAVMLMTLVIVLINYVRDRKRADDSYVKPGDEFATSMKVKALLFGVGVGFLIAGTSVGGGVVIIPVLITFFNMSPRNTVGTSVAISLALAFISCGSFFLFSWLLGQDVPYLTCVVTSLVMFVGAIPGTTLGCRAAVKVPQKVLRTVVVFLIVIAIVGMLAGPFIRKTLMGQADDEAPAESVSVHPRRVVDTYENVCVLNGNRALTGDTACTN